MNQVENLAEEKTTTKKMAAAIERYSKTNRLTSIVSVWCMFCIAVNALCLDAYVTNAQPIK